MKQKVLTMLALLLMTATGAMAQTETLLTTITATGQDSYSETTPGVVTVTHDNDNYDGDYGWLWYGHAGSVTVVANEGYTITKCVFSQADKGVLVTVSTAPFEAKFVEAHPFASKPDYVKYLCEGTDLYDGIDGFTKIEVYGYASAPAPVSVTIGATGWATFVSDAALDFSKSAVKAYIVTDHYDYTLIKTQMTGTVPANTPLLLNAAAGIHNIPVVASSSTSVEGNKLVAGTGVSVGNGDEEEKERYVLVAEADGTTAVFRRIGYTSAKVPVGKAYLEFQGETEARVLYIVPGEATGIDGIETAKAAEGVYYNIAGQRVAQPTKGLYIVNGKKVMVK